MYCPACGIDSVEGLKYCKRCGASLNSTSHLVTKKPMGLIGLFLLVIGVVGVLGVSLPLTMARELISYGFRTQEIMILSFGGGIFALVLAALLSRVLLKIIESASGYEGPLPKSRWIAQGPQQIPSPPAAIGSVTENTTRSFDKRRFEDAQI